jgi:signal transduction histidine kinase/integral membrane sensor domain MASE1
MGSWFNGEHPWGSAVAVALVYYLSALIGQTLVLPSAPVSALWLPNALLASALLMTPRRQWWVYLLTVLPIHLLAPLPVPHLPGSPLLLQYVINCATALIGALALTRAPRETFRLDRVRSAGRLIVVGGALVPASNAVLMAGAFLAFGGGLRDLGAVGAHALANAFAMLTLAPLIASGVDWLGTRQRSPNLLRTTEAALLSALLTAAGGAVFFLPTGEIPDGPTLPYLPLPMLLWAATRFGILGTCGAMLWLGVLTIVGAHGGGGPFVSRPPLEATLSILVFLVVTSIPLLLLAAAMEERRSLARGRQRSEERFRSLFEHNIIPTVLWRDGCISDANDAFLQMTGYTSAEVSTGNLRRDLLASGLPDGGGPPMERELMLRDGRRIPALIGACQFRGDILEGAAFACDLSGSRHAQAAQRRAEILHGAVLASIHDQIVVLDQEGIIVDANDSSWQLAGRFQAAPFVDLQIGRSFLQQCIDAGSKGDVSATRLAERVTEVIAGRGARYQLEHFVPTPEGIAFFEVTIEPLRRAGGGAVMIWADITQRKQADAQAKAQHEQLAHLGRVAVLGELSAAFAHELNQPLMSILGNGEAALQLLDQPHSDLGEIRSMLRDIVADDIRAAEVIKRLRGLLTRGEISRQPIDLNQVIRDVFELARGDIAARQVNVILELDPYLPQALGDLVQLQQVILNLIVNACEAMSANDADKRRLTVSTRFDPDSCEIACTVRDNGGGIVAGDLEHIFLPFVTTKSAGMGMGLAICRSIIEAHGGRLGVENAVDGGAVFTFTVKMGS